MTFQDDDNFKLSTPQEQKFFVRYAVDKDVVAATLHAYKISEDNARDYGLKVLGRARIKALVDKYLRIRSNLPSADELRALYFEIFEQSPEPRIRLQALTAYERVSGFSKPKKAIDDAFDVLDDISG